MLFKMSARYWCLIAFILAAGLLIPATAQSALPNVQTVSRIVGAIDDSVRVTVPRSTHPMAKPYFDIGPLSGDTALERMILVLAGSPEQEYEARTLLDSQQTKGSPDYHHWLTPEEFGLRFGPSQADIQQVSAWLRHHGFTLGKVAKSGRWIEFTGTSAQVEEAFQTQMHQYLIAGNLHLANATDISIPAALAPVVKGVASLHNFFKKPMISHFTPVRQEQGHLVRVPNPELTTSKGNHFLAPADFDTIYDLNSLLGTINGAGQTIAIVARSNISQNDVTTFRQTFGLAPNTTNVIVNGLDPGDVPGDDIEAILDTEWSGAVAPGATIDVVVSASTLSSDGVDLSAAFIVDNNLAPIMSVSFGQCEKLLGVQENAFFNSLWQQAAAQGTSVFVAAGDNGAAGCDDPNPNTTPATGGLAVSGLASTPFNTAVGGTEFNETVNGNTAANFWNSTNGLGFESAKGYIPEMVWNESCSPGQAGTDCAGQTFFELFAGSGGASSLYSKPSWQSTSITGVPNDGARDLPDVSLTAAGHDGYIICFQEDPTIACQVSGGVLVQAAVVGGTSASSPSFAGIMALIDQKVGGRQGLANYVLYNLALNKENFSNCNSSNRTNPGTGTSCIFNDTTAGNNNVPGQTGSSAGTGYDLASGLGSVDANNLATAWGNATFQATVTSITTSMGATVNITHGQSITLTGQVQKSPSGAGPTGSIAFVTDQPGPQGGFLTVGAGGLSGSPASFSQSFSNLPGGTYNLSAHYPGDGTFAASDSAGIPVNVAKENTNVSLQAHVVNLTTGVISPPPASVPYGDPNNIIVFDGTVSGVSGAGFPTGNIFFSDGGNVIAASALSTGGAQQLSQAEVANCFSLSCLTVGPHSISVSYPNGDNSFNSSGPSNAVSITIGKGNPQGGAIVLVGQLVGDTPTRFLVGFKDPIPGTIAPSGSVQLFDGTTPLGSPVQLDSFGNTGGQLTITTGGSHTLTAQYSGDSTYNAATSQPLTVTPQAPFQFAPFNSTNTLSATVAAGGTATFNIQLDQVVGSTFTGTVAMTCSGAPAGTTCSINPPSANVSSLLVPVTVTVNTTTSAQLRSAPFNTWSPVFAGVLGILVCGISRKRKLAMLLMLLSLLLILGVTACGGGGGGGGGTINRPPTIATLTVTGTSGSFTSSINLNLTITH